MKTVNLAKELIGFETVSPVEDPEIFEFVKLYLEDEGVDVEVREINGVFNLVAETGSGEKAVCLNGHLDVVDPGKGWEVTDPFKPVVKDGKLYGRGAADMKAGAAALVNAFIDLHNDPEFEGKVTLMLVGDEEIGGENGSKALVDEFYGIGKRFDYVVVGEPTDLDIQTGTRGVAWFNVYLKGEEIHAARADKVDNVMENLPLVIEELNSIDMTNGKNPELPEPGLEVTSLETNETYNSIPSWVKIGMDVRYLPSQSMEEIEQKIKDALEKTDADYRIELEQDHGGAYILQDQRFRDIATEAVNEVRGENPDYVTEGGGSDGRFFWEKGTPFIELGVNQKPAHMCDEHCEVENLEKLREMYYLMSKKLVRKHQESENLTDVRRNMDLEKIDRDTKAV